MIRFSQNAPETDNCIDENHCATPRLRIPSRMHELLFDAKEDSLKRHVSSSKSPQSYILNFCLVVIWHSLCVCVCVCVCVCTRYRHTHRCIRRGRCRSTCRPGRDTSRCSDTRVPHSHQCSSRTGLPRTQTCSHSCEMTFTMINFKVVTLVSHLFLLPR